MLEVEVGTYMTGPAVALAPDEGDEAVRAGDATEPLGPELPQAPDSTASAPRAAIVGVFMNT